MNRKSLSVFIGIVGIVVLVIGSILASVGRIPWWLGLILAFVDFGLLFGAYCMGTGDETGDD